MECCTGNDAILTHFPELGDEAAVMAWLEKHTRDPKLLAAALDERQPYYQGLSSGAVTRIRAAVFLKLADCASLPEPALAHVLEELEFPHRASLTAAAAYCLRHTTTPHPDIAPILEAAHNGIRTMDDVVEINGASTTAVAEIERTLEWLGAVQANDHALCKPATILPHDFATIAPIELEDHNGLSTNACEILRDHWTVVVFFYTRCENPLKCPVTITRLGELQRLVQSRALEDEIHTAAITYDPDYDTPPRLERYRRTWGAESGPGFRMLRTRNGYETIKNYFNLGVSYSDTTVNRHRLEAFILDPTGHIRFANTRSKWTADGLLGECERLIQKQE